MADHDSIVSSDKIKAVADAIREKTHKDNLMTLDEMPDEIASISGGGGDMPECGIVPTSWASNGYVLTADSYGDVLPGALNNGDNSVDTHDTTIPESIDITEISGSGFYGQQAFNYLRSVTFQTAPEYIGHEAFAYQYWMEISSLPEGIEYIGADAFNQCYNLALDTIPASVDEIDTYAFYYSNNKQYLSPNYDEHSTYDIGDTVYYSGNIYTCITPIESAESFDSNNWVQDYYPELVGIYDPTTNYNNGDIVYVDDDYNNIKTCCYITKVIPNIWEDSYCPGVIGLVVDGQSYNVGDVVAFYTDESTHTVDVYTCISYVASADARYPDGYHWISGYYPEILGVYDSNTSYSIGDIVIMDVESSGGVFTCVQATTGELDYSCWAYGYAPTILGNYDESHTYSVGDVVGVGQSDSIVAATYVGDYESPEVYNGFLEGYYPNITVYSDQTAYAIGDTVYYNGSIFTCINPTTAGETPDLYDHSYWVFGYYPEILGEYDEEEDYSIGDVVYDTNQDYAKTLVQPYGEIITLTLISGCYPDLLGTYDSSHTYNCGDVVYITDDYSSDIYICLSPTPVTGEFDPSYWRGFMNSVGNRFVVNKLRFLGTPGSIGSYAFENSGYSLFLVPWSNGEGPFIQLDHDQFIVYDYHPESNSN